MSRRPVALIGIDRAQEPGRDLAAQVERALARPVTSVAPSDLEALGPDLVVVVATPVPPGPGPEVDAGAHALLDDLHTTLTWAQASSSATVVTLSASAAADPTTPAGAVSAVAERLTTSAGHTAVRLEAGAKGLGALVGAAAASELAGRVVTGPAVGDDGTTDPALWSADEIFRPTPTSGVWATQPARLRWDRVAAALGSGGWEALIEVAAPPAPAPSMSVLLSPPVVAGREHELVAATLDSGWLAPAGPQLDAFEADLSRWADDQPTLALSSGTAGLHLALLVSGVRPGDEVVVQTATFAASAFAIAHAGAVPILCDVDHATGNLDPDLLAHHLEARAAQGRLPAAVIAVDLYGTCADYQRLHTVCQRYDLPLIQDSAESLGSRSAGAAAGTHGHLGVFSFNGNKIITTSGGGALIGPAELVEQARKLSTQARQPGLHYEHHEVGYNYRLSGLLASVGQAQLETLPQRIETKAAAHRRYVEGLPGLGWFPTGVTERWNHWLSVARLPDQIPPHLVCRRLAAAGIEARPCWKPMHRQPVFAAAEAWVTGPADEWYAHGLCLPSGFGLVPEAQDRVIAELGAVLDDLA